MIHNDCYIESTRLKNFRLNIAKQIPKFPNNKASLQKLENLSLAELLIHYANWAIRYVSVRKRNVHIEATALSDKRWKTLKPSIEHFLQKVREGVELTPHLSLDPHTRGYTPSPDANRWEDKDFLLNVMGFHHFHLGTETQPGGFVTRTDHLIFAEVTRTEFSVVAIFDHSVFDEPTSPEAAMSDERTRLWKLFDEISSRGIPPGSVYMPAMITTSGHQTHLTFLASDYSKVIREIDPKLDDPNYVLELYKQSSLPIPKKPKLEWRLNFLDLGLLDRISNTLLVLRNGPN